jgi:hypothetical protein
MTNFKVITTTGDVFTVEAWSEDKVLWLMSYEGYEVSSITKI